MILIPKIYSRKHSQKLQMGTQTQPLVENLSTSMLNMLVRDGSEEGQVQSKMGQPAQDDIKSSEEETYAANLWQDLQQIIKQDCLTKRKLRQCAFRVRMA